LQQSEGDWDFDSLKPNEVTGIKVGGREYVLREASEGAAVAYREASAGSAVWQDGKVVGFKGTAGVEPLLVSLCLFEVAAGGKRHQKERRVPLEEVKAFTPGSIVKRLFAKAKEISPWLDDTPGDSVEDIDKKIARLRQLREQLSRGDSPPKDSPDGSGDSSD
jgi:hypothetical protein